MNALSVLTGEAPGAVDDQLRDSKPLPPIPSVLDVGVPSALARRRPDIRQSEASLHAATAGVGVAVAQFYPDISLTGDIGMRALDASYLTNWASHFYSAGPAISLPIFSGGRLTANLTLARAEQQAAVLNALREVEDALVAYRTDRVARDLLQDALNSAQVTWELSQNQYDHASPATSVCWMLSARCCPIGRPWCSRMSSSSMTSWQSIEPWAEGGSRRSSNCQHRMSRPVRRRCPPRWIGWPTLDRDDLCRCAQKGWRASIPEIFPSALRVMKYSNCFPLW